MRFDTPSSIMYSASWGECLFALKVNALTGAAIAAAPNSSAADAIAQSLKERA